MSANPRGREVKDTVCQNPALFLPQSVSQSVWTETDRDRDFWRLYDPAASRGPVVAPQTQEIPLLLLRGSVVAACLCVYICGADPVCMCQSRTGIFMEEGSGGGVTVPQGPTNPSTDGPQSRGTRTRKVKQTQPRPFSQDASRHSYWPTHKADSCFFIGPLAFPPLPPPSSLLFSLRKLLEVWPLNFDPFGKAF